MQDTCLEVAERELRNWGVKPQVYHRAKHVELSWNSLSGERRYVIVSSTSGNRTALLNARAEVRRILRSDGMLVEEAVEPPKPKPNGAGAVLSAALTLPPPVRSTRQLADDVDALTGIVFELSEKVDALSARLEVLAAAAAAMQPPVASEPVVVVVKPPTIKELGDPVKALMSADEYVHFATLSERSGINKDKLKDVLQALKRDGIVERGHLGLWKLTKRDGRVGDGNH